MEVLRTGKGVARASLTSLLLVAGACSSEEGVKECTEPAPAVFLAEATPDSAQPDYSELTDPEWIATQHNQAIGDAVKGEKDGYILNIALKAVVDTSDLVCRDSEGIQYITSFGAGVALRNIAEAGE